MILFFFPEFFSLFSGLKNGQETFWVVGLFPQFFGWGLATEGRIKRVAAITHGESHQVVIIIAVARRRRSCGPPASPGCNLSSVNYTQPRQRHTTGRWEVTDWTILLVQCGPTTTTTINVETTFIDPWDRMDQSYSSNKTQLSSSSLWQTEYYGTFGLSTCFERMLMRQLGKNVQT